MSELYSEMWILQALLSDISEGSIIIGMNLGYKDKLETAKRQYQTSKAELEELEQQIRTFEILVDARLGDLLDQLSELNVETIALDENIRKIREQRLYGADLIRYLDGAPRPGRAYKLDDLPPPGLPHRKAVHTTIDDPSNSPELQIPDIKALYRKLARRYHPDLTRNEADRIHTTEQMAEINRAYNVGDLASLMRIAGISIPYSVGIHQPHIQPASPQHESLTELEQIELKWREVRQHITYLSNLLIVKLSLDVKLARHQGRDLLTEMAVDLQRKVERKIAERDYLKAQIKVSGDLNIPDIDQG